jgi:hypothetical protein
MYICATLRSAYPVYFCNLYAGNVSEMAAYRRIECRMSLLLHIGGDWREAYQYGVTKAELVRRGRGCSTSLQVKQLF